MVAWAVLDCNGKLVSLLLTTLLFVFTWFLSHRFWHVNKGACACAM